MKKILMLLLTLGMVFNASFAAGFTDLDQAKWAIDYIEKVQALNIVTGFSDGSFKPNEAVNHYVAILTLYRTLDSQKLVMETDKTVLKNRYAFILSNKKVPNWPNLPEAVAFALEYKIITEKDLDSFMVNGEQQLMTREQFALFMGRGLNLFLKEDTTNQIITVSFKDVAKITFENLKYVNLLVKHKVMGGDNNNNFLPKESLTRAALAKMVVTGIDVLKSKVSEEQVIQATVMVKTDDSKRVIFYDVVDKTKSYIEIIDDSVQVTLGGAKATYADLDKDMPTTLTYLNGKLSKVAATPVIYVTVPASGDVLDVINGAKRAVFVKSDKDSTSKFYNLEADTVVTSYGKPSSFDKLQKTDYVVMTLQNNIVKTLDFKVKFRTLKGVIKEVLVDGVPKVIVTVAGENMTFTFADGVVVTRNTAIKNIGALLSGDEITFDATFEAITKVVATGVVSKDTGTITKIALGTKNELSLKDAKGLETTYEVDKNALILVDGKTATFFDLRANYTVELKIDNNVIKEIRAVSILTKSFVTGVIEKVYLDLNVITVKVGTDIYTVYMTDVTLKMAADGSKITIGAFKPGQKVFCYGVMEDRIIRGDKVFRFEE